MWPFKIIIHCKDAQIMDGWVVGCMDGWMGE